MIFFICYENPEEKGRRHVLFDIEYYMTYNSSKKYNRKNDGSIQVMDDIWFSELNVFPIVDGIVNFTKDMTCKSCGGGGEDSNRFDHNTFIEDASEISELRGLLYERFDNSCKTMDAADKFHYDIFQPVLEEKINRFSEKYGLVVIKDYIFPLLCQQKV